MKKLVSISIACAAFATALTANTKSDLAALESKLMHISEELASLKNQNKKHDIVIERKKSPEFLLGKETAINMKFKAQDDKSMWLKAGVRVQGSFEDKKTDYLDDSKTDKRLQDAYLRRVRFEVAAGFGKHTSFVMDIRNDKANYQDKGEGKFNVGDAYLKIKKPFDTSLVNFKLYRAKIDISRTETVKSARVIMYDRPKVADAAAQFITENRRATNVQMYGDWNKKLHYQVALGDATASGHSVDARGDKLEGSIKDQRFFYGGKIRLSPFDGWEETKRTESYFGEGKHFSLGVGYWKADNIVYSTKDMTDHTLINYELSAHYYNAFVQAEYFDFDGVVEAWGSEKTGKSTGWYVSGEYVIPSLGYIAPFFRYEKWDKLKDTNGYEYSSKVAGMNWYLRGNTTKVGFLVQKDTYGEEIGNKETTAFRVTSQWFF